MKKFDLEHQYALYLERVKLKEEDMHPTQKTETKRAFMGACGQLLMLLRDDLTELEEEKVIEVMESMQAQVLFYFINETNRI